MATIPDLNVYRSAQQVIRERGNLAAHEAALRAEALMKIGDTLGEATWLRVVEAIRVLQDRENPRGTVRH
jgi:hypothetical protein